MIVRNIVRVNILATLCVFTFQPKRLGSISYPTRKYEYGERTPEGSHDRRDRPLPRSEPLLSLKSDWRSDANDVIHVLFDLEEALCLEPIKVGGNVVLALPEDLGSEDQETLAKALRHWYRNSRDLKDGELTRDEYVAWKDSFKAQIS